MKLASIQCQAPGYVFTPDFFIRIHTIHREQSFHGEQGL